MRYHGLDLQPMQESGAFLLRAMQNEDMPRLDLLVRESVQNSLDAAVNKEPGSEVKIDFKVREHTTATIASLFNEGLDLKMLGIRYPDGGKLLEIRDSLTEGLTGALSFNEIGADRVHGNLLKLVFEIGRTRSEDGAGGSWGLGKTCYFRMGAGLIIYYSRIRLGDGYQERLVASLVEDESRSDRLQQNSRTGIGWWGADSGLQPVTKNSVIHHTLNMLRIQPFQGAETGTAIIIPFLREDLVPATEKDEDGAVVRRPPWCKSYEAYIEVALGRWFSARLDNPKFAAGPRLTASVNGTVIRRSRMLPVFQATQALYNLAVHGTFLSGDFLQSLNLDEDAFLRKAVSPRGIFVSPGAAGHIAAVLLTPEQLGMGEPENCEDPAMCVFGRADKIPPFRPLVTFMRRPGMCVCWDDSTESRGWVGGLPGVSDGRYLVAVFVPEHDRILAGGERRVNGNVTVSLESYLRSCERADHATWHDISGLKIVEKIRLNSGKMLREFGAKPSVTSAIEPAIRMARNLADLVLPGRGMGSDGRTGRMTDSKSLSSKNVREHRRFAPPGLEILSVNYHANGLDVRWSLVWGNVDHSNRRQIVVRVDSESGPISARDWCDDGLGVFPFLILDANLDHVNRDSPAEGVEFKLEHDATDSLLLRRTGGAANANVTGSLRIGFASEAAKVFRPILSAALLEPSKENS
jgi:hypothetical protein